MRDKIITSILWWLPRGLAHKLLYRWKMKRKLNLKNPKTLNEKVHWLELYYYGEKEAKLTDKLLVKDYIKNLNIKDLNIPKIYKIIKDSDDINKLDLPDKYVLKCNHGSGDVFICRNKKKFDLKNALMKLRKLKRRDFAKVVLEYHYSLIKPEIICEEYLDELENNNPTDYKFFCFDGYVNCVMVCTDRSNNNYRDFFDRNWNHLIDYSVKDRQSKEKIIKPENIDRMFEIASELSKGYPFVRVDLYNLNGKIYFGEMTFTPAAGLAHHYTEMCDEKLGAFIDINKLKYKGSI